MNKIIKHFILLFVMLNLFQHLAVAQNKQTDSLLSLLRSPKSQHHDTTRIKTLNALAWELRNNKPDTAIILSTQALALAQKNKWKKGESKSYGYLGAFNYLKGNYSLALDYYLKALLLLPLFPGCCQVMISSGNLL